REPSEGSSAFAPPGSSESITRSAGDAQASEERPPATKSRKAPRPYGFPPGSGGGGNGIRPVGRGDPEVSPAASAGQVESRPAGATRVDHEAADRGGIVASAACPKDVHVAGARGEPACDECERSVLFVGAVQDRVADRLPCGRPEGELARARMVRQEQHD